MTSGSYQYKSSLSGKAVTRLGGINGITGSESPCTSPATRLDLGCMYFHSLYQGSAAHQGSVRFPCSRREESAVPSRCESAKAHAVSVLQFLRFRQVEQFHHSGHSRICL